MVKIVYNHENIDDHGSKFRGDFLLQFLFQICIDVQDRVVRGSMSQYADVRKQFFVHEREVSVGVVLEDGH